MKNRIKQKNIIISAFSVTAMMLLFKAIGFVKQAVIAYYFGASGETDAYFIAYGFVNSITEIIVKSISFSIIAIYSTIVINKGKEYANKTISAILELLTPIFIFLTVSLCIFAPLVAKLIAPSYEESGITLIVSFIYSLSPLILLCMFELIFGAILDANKKFYISRLQSCIYSIAIILLCITMSKYMGIKSLILGQYLSSILFFIILIVAIKKYWKFSFTKIKYIPEIKQIIVTAIPLFIGAGVIQLNQIIDKSISSSLGVGNASALSYCQTLQQFVTNIMIVNIGNVLFSQFSEYNANKRFNELSNTLCKAINIIICLLIPITIITIIYSKEIVSIVYCRGNFNTQALTLTSAALIGYSISFVFVGIRDLIIKSLYSLKNTFYPMIASIASIIINVIFSIYLSKRIGIIGVTLATSISAFIGMIINVIVLKKFFSIYKFKKNLITIIKNIPSGIILIVFIIIINNYIPKIIGFWICSILGLLIYAVFLWIFKVEEIVQLKNKIFRKVINKNE